MAWFSSENSALKSDSIGTSRDADHGGGDVAVFGWTAEGNPWICNCAGDPVQTGDGLHSSYDSNELRSPNIISQPTLARSRDPGVRDLSLGVSDLICRAAIRAVTLLDHTPKASHANANQTIFMKTCLRRSALSSPPSAPCISPSLQLSPHLFEILSLGFPCYKERH